MKKKITALILSFIMVFALVPQTSASFNLTIDEFMEEIANTYKDMYPGKEHIVDDVVNILINDVQFIYMFEDNPDEAYLSAVATLDGSLTVIMMPFGSYGNYWFYADYTVPYVSQILTYYCGPAAISQALIGNGVLSNTASNKNRAFLDARATSMGTTSANGTHINNMRSQMNSYYSSSNPYAAAYCVTEWSIDNAMVLLQNSLAQGYVPIIQFYNTNLLSYYNQNYTHYVVVESIDLVSSTIWLVDPHWDSSTYGDYRQVSLTNFKDALKATTTNSSGVLGNSWILYKA